MREDETKSEINIKSFIRESLLFARKTFQGEFLTKFHHRSLNHCRNEFFSITSTQTHPVSFREKTWKYDENFQFFQLLSKFACASGSFLQAASLFSLQNMIFIWSRCCKVLREKFCLNFLEKSGNDVTSQMHKIVEKLLWLATAALQDFSSVVQYNELFNILIAKFGFSRCDLANLNLEKIFRPRMAETFHIVSDKTFIKNIYDELIHRKLFTSAGSEKKNLFEIYAAMSTNMFTRLLVCI